HERTTGAGPSPTVSFAAAAPAGAVVGVPVGSGTTVVGDGHGLDLDALRAQGFEGKVGETARVGGRVAVGVGDLAGVTPEVVRKASGSLVKATAKVEVVANLLLDAVAERDRPAAGRAAAEGTIL